MGLQETMGFPLVSGSFHKTKGKVLFVKSYVKENRCLPLTRYLILCLVSILGKILHSCALNTQLN